MEAAAYEARRDASGGYEVDVSRGERIGRVSSEWFSRPDDERFLSLTDLQASVRFAREAAPALTRFANSSPAPFVTSIRSAREKIVAKGDDDRSDFLRKRGVSKAETQAVIDMVLAEEGRPPSSVFDFVQGITAVARGKAHQDARLDYEGRARRLLEAA